MRCALALATGVMMVLGASAPAPAADAPSGKESAISCRGEEPFWGLEASRTEAVMTTPDGRTQRAGTLDVLDWLPPGWLVWRSAATEPRLVLVLRAEACFSTMADEPPRSHRALLIDGDARPAAGCCSLTTPEPSTSGRGR
jgi:uncharacterized membrane protein